ncbi:MAG: T9SS type A sorting domain-containing protein [Deferribacteres bacterium]|nr:T9SS type A sorting domain-containing protein [candidate division KSB1 bacterium]MCB9501696.1 T9SS type A sorting domain-containing protein [Deferribacteres bacterium]
MKNRNLITLIGLVVSGLFLLQMQMMAGGALAISSTNKPYKWDVSRFPIKYHVDLGNCGLQSNEAMQELVANSIAKWTTSHIPYSSVQFEFGGLLDVDVTTGEKFEEVELAQDNKNPIIFDVDGSIVKDLGMDESVIGLASPVYVTQPPLTRIVKGIALLNGDFLDGNRRDGHEMTTEEFGAIILHEFGHFLNLDHTQVNGHHFIQDSDPGFELYGDPPISSVSIMFPLSLGLGEPTEPQADDIRAIASLYPTTAFTNETKSITGRILLPDGVTPLTGANVVARNVNDPFHDVASQVSGALTADNPDDPDFAGYFTLSGLTAGANYTIEVVNINSRFNTNSSVGPINVPIVLDAPEEFYNAGDESGNGASDNPANWTAVAAGSNGIHIILNNAATAVEEQDNLSNPVPASLQLFANYPNPFGRKVDGSGQMMDTSISFAIPRNETVHLAVYDILGRKIRTLVDKDMPAGQWTVKWDSRNETGQMVADGVYFYRITSGTTSITKRMLFLD